MRSTRRRDIAGICLLVAAIGVLAASQAAHAAPRSFYGVVPQTALGDADFDRMGQGKVGTLRTIVNWFAVDATSDPGDAYDWSSVDPIVAAAARNGVTVLPFLYGTPDWVARDLDRYRCGGNCAVFAPRSKPALRAWSDFVAAAVDRFGRGGTFWQEHPEVPQKPIRAWQVWNEQNSPTFYKPKPKPRRYARVLDVAAKAIRGNDRRAEVVLGGMAGLPGVRGSAITAWDYLGKLYDLRGSKRDFDGIAPHPYGARLGKVRDQIELLRREARKAGDGGVDMYVTEIGWSSSRGGNPLNRGPRGQAARLKQAYRFFERRRNRLNVKTVTWFSWVDSPSRICDWCANSGLFKIGLVEKPAWRAFTNLTGGR